MSLRNQDVRIVIRVWFKPNAMASACHIHIDAGLSASKRRERAEDELPFVIVFKCDREPLNEALQVT